MAIIKLSCYESQQLIKCAVKTGGKKNKNGEILLKNLHGMSTKKNKNLITVHDD